MSGAGRRRVGLAFLVIAVVGTTAWGQVRNVVMIVADDQRLDAVGAFGDGVVSTPNLDGLAARGVSFRNAYCMGAMMGAVCAPSRAMFLSGRTLFHIGANPYDTQADVKLLPEMLRERGFTTFGTGKWHNGKGAYARSFDGGGSIFLGGMGSHTELLVHDFDAAGAYPNSARRKIREFSSAEFASSAVGFLESEAAGEPFFLYLSFTAPHDPRTPPVADRERYIDAGVPLPANYMPVHPFDNGEMVIRDEALAAWPRTEEEVERHLAEYYGMITHMDRQIGRVLGALEESGRAGETLVVFFADHGLAVGSHGLMGKQNVYEHSTKAPLIFAGPGVGRGVVSAAPVYLLDIPATVCELLGVDSGWCPESASAAAAVRGEAFAGRSSVMTVYRDMQRAVRVGDWKLIRYPRINRTQLFDLAADPDELNDLSGDAGQADRIVGLLGELGRWQERVGDVCPLSTENPGSGVFDYERAERGVGGRSGG